MRKILISCVAFIILLIATSCTDPYSDELDKLKTDNTTADPPGEGDDPVDAPLPGH